MLNGVSSFDFVKLPKCKNCKYYITNQLNPNLGLCKIFSNRIFIDKNEKIIYNYAKHCRDDEFLCGKNGWLYEEKDSILMLNKNIKLNEYYL
jgi:hypothetical protein